MQNFRLSPAAESDLTDIWTYRADSSEERADELIEQLVKQFMMLTTFPEAGRKRPEVKKGIRSFVAERHVIFYRTLNQGIEIVRVLYGTRDIDKIFSDDSSS
ncbi:MAG: type II toxin-antitoxin system RelE/ParE family toxin [Phormidesmis priestleyi]|uniref:Toxin n=1 Tax=Phormidesmis priestleyi TaxID=268141 RepID=A0A2W4YL39_9CYAN|nr:MAG: type II toxin-antitoxin system RelE/ParE family toxin [Phormidesmis priestleyi]